MTDSFNDLSLWLAQKFLFLGRFGDNRPKDRLPSVQVRPEWDVLEEMDFPRLLKLNLPGITATAQDIGDHQYGSLYYYDKVWL